MQDIEILNIGANTHQGCTDFDRDAEIWVVGFRERLVAYARSGGQVGGSLKRPPGCTDFSLDAEILGRRVPRATAGGPGSLKMASVRGAGQIRFSGAPWCVCLTLRARPLSEAILFC
jgi:hypothetical protein